MYLRMIKTGLPKSCETDLVDLWTCPQNLPKQSKSNNVLKTFLFGFLENLVLWTCAQNVSKQIYSKVIHIKFYLVPIFIWVTLHIWFDRREMIIQPKCYCVHECLCACVHECICLYIFHVTNRLSNQVSTLDSNRQMKQV